MFTPCTARLFIHVHSYWAAIDDALRHAAFDRGVRVRLMASLWPSTSADMHQYLLSLAALDGISANSQFNVSIEVVSKSLVLASFLHALVLSL